MIPADVDTPCRRLSPEVADKLFFPPNPVVRLQVLDMCGNDKQAGECAYRTDCRKLGEGEEYGIYGGEFAVNINRGLARALPEAA